MLWFVISCLYIVAVASFVDAGIRRESAREILKEGLRVAAYFIGGLAGVAAVTYFIARLAYG